MKALILGVGNIGFRHAQGLSRLSEKNLEIYLFDVSDKYLSIFKEEINILKKKTKLFLVKNNFSEIKSIEFDIVIIATTADKRVKSLNSILNEIKTKLILIEKPICNSIKDLNFLKDISSKNIFINFPRRYCDWHNKIKDKIIRDYSNEILDISITGKNLGIACNISHYIDLVNMWTSCYPLKVDGSNLDEWKNSKRKGFYEVDGSLEIYFNNNHKLKLISDKKFNDHKVSISSQLKKNICVINYSEGYAKFDDQVKINGKSKFQSESTNILYESLVLKEKYSISDLNLGIKCYEKVLFSLIRHWNKKNKSNVNKIMIT